MRYAAWVVVLLSAVVAALVAAQVAQRRSHRWKVQAIPVSRDGWEVELRWAPPHAVLNPARRPANLAPGRETRRVGFLWLGERRDSVLDDVLAALGMRRAADLWGGRTLEVVEFRGPSGRRIVCQDEDLFGGWQVVQVADDADDRTVLDRAVDLFRSQNAR